MSQINWKIQLFELNYDEEEVKAVEEVVRSGWLTMGTKTKSFEERFAALLGSGSSAIAVSSGTAALHMALMALGIGPGDEVILPGLTFIADANVVRMVGAKPVLADCTSFDDWNIDPLDVERKITAKTRAIIVVHYAGYPCTMDALAAICAPRRVAIIEDSAHAIDATYRGRQCGTFGEVGCFSFFANKNLSVGEGGMYVARSQELVRQGRYLRSHGMSTLTLDRHQGRAISYDVLAPGLNYRIDELRAALGLVQLDRLKKANAARKDLTLQYRNLLAGCAGASVPFQDLTGVEPSYHIFPILLGQKVDRTRTIHALRDRGIQTSIHYPAIQRFTAYRSLELGATPIANAISERELTLPLFPNMSAEQVELVVRSLKEVLA
jgi:dTDP-4-amino-4,6-dideoxygalactose transaminase